MNNLFDVVNNIYTNRSSDWLQEVTGVSGFMVFKFLTMNPQLIKVTKFLNRYVYSLPDDMFLALAWSVVPKVNKAPYCKFIKSVEDDDKDLLLLVQKRLKMSDNDINSSWGIIKKTIFSKPSYWFSVLGVDKEFYKNYGVVNVSREVGDERVIKKGLDEWF